MTEEKTSDEKFIERVCNNPTVFDSLLLTAARKQVEIDTKDMTELEVIVYKLMQEIRFTWLLQGNIRYKEIDEIVKKHLLP